jgi:hypothetical protein
VGLDVLIARFRARRICLILYPYSQNVVLRNSNSSRRVSLSHRALALGSRAQVGTYVGRFLVDLMALGDIRSLVYVNAKKTEVAVYLYLHGVLCILVKAIQMVKKTSAASLIRIAR